MTVINKFSGIEELDLAHSQSHTTMYMVTYDAMQMMHDYLLDIVIIMTCTLLTHS